MYELGVLGFRLIQLLTSSRSRQQPTSDNHIQYHHGNGSGFTNTQPAATRHGACRLRSMSFTTAFVALVAVAVVATFATTNAFQCDTKSVVKFPSLSRHDNYYTRHSNSRLFVIPGQGYHPNRGSNNNNGNGNKERRNPFMPPINGDAAKSKHRHTKNPTRHEKENAGSTMSNTQASSRQQKQPWSSSYVPTAPPSVASNAGDLIKNVDYLRQQSQEAALAANELLERNRQDLLRRSQEASERADPF